MAGTLQDMINRIASELRRADLATTQIPNAIADAIAVYAQERFAFSEVAANGDVTFETVAGQDTYTASDCADLGTLMQIDHVNINIGTATNYELKRDTPEALILYNQQVPTMQGQPSWYAYENSALILAARPDQAYLITLALFRNIAAPALADVDNPWMTTAERLIRARTKYEIAVHVTRNPTMATAMSPSPPAENGGVVGAAYREWKQLKGTANRSSGRGIIRPMQF